MALRGIASVLVCTALYTTPHAPATQGDTLRQNVETIPEGPLGNSLL